MDSSMNVPCISVDNDNFQKWWPYITNSLRNCDFISIDLELSGLGPKEIFICQIDERFKLLKNVASTRSILSIGIACFCMNPNKGFFKRMKSKNSTSVNHVLDQIRDCLDKSESEYKFLGTKPEEELNDQNFYATVDVFNLLTLNHNEFTIESKSMKFLASQGFDFNELSLKGIPFYSGNDDPTSVKTMCRPSIRRLINLIISLKLPVIFHNGFIDLAFLYHNFYAQIPNKLDTFVADLSEMFPNGIFDTKYIGNSYLSCSYLEYLFQYSQRQNHFRRLRNLPCLELEFTDFKRQNSEATKENDLFFDIRYFDLSPKIMQHDLNNQTQICYNYAKKGWCEKADKCEQSHNIDLILDEELKSKKDKKTKQLVMDLKKRAKVEQRKESTNCEDSTVNSDSGDEHLNKPLLDEPPPLRKYGCHHAGNDAFMTGYFFLFNNICESKFNCTHAEFKQFSKNLPKFKNKIFLTGKPQPLNIMKSSYSNCSSGHKNKFEMIKQKNDWF